MTTTYEDLRKVRSDAALLATQLIDMEQSLRALFLTTLNEHLRAVVCLDCGYPHGGHTCHCTNDE